MGSQKKVKPIGLILAGGESKRLFPLKIAKPLLEVGGKFLIEEAIERLKGFDIWIVTNAIIAKQIKTALKKKGRKLPNFAIEPEPRDTAAAVGFGLQVANPKKLDRWVAILTADHWMPESRKFDNFLQTVSEEIEKFPHSLFVAGSPPEAKAESSHSQFGWIRCKDEGSVSLRVERFVEKPQGALLDQMRATNGLINGGMFFGKWNVFYGAYEKLYPQVLSKKKLSRAAYAKLERQPIDRAIFEKFPNVRALPQSLRWEDLGTWIDWFELMGEGTATRLDCEEVFVSTKNLKVFAFDVKDLAIIESEGRLLVMPLSKTRDLKNILSALPKS